MPYTVYIGDFSSEVRDLRPLVIEQVRRVGLVPLWMDDDERHQPDMAERLRSRIAEADYFIAIVAYRYGWQPPDMGGRALAEIEFDLAQQMGKPGAVLLPDASGELALYLRQRAISQNDSERSAQNDFHQRLVASGSALFFKDEADLTRQLITLLQTWAQDGQGGMFATQTAAAPPPAERRVGGLDGLDLDAFSEDIAERTAAKLALIQQRQQQDLAEQTLRVNEALRLWPGELVFGRPSKSSQFKSDIFMIMPFAEPFSIIYRNIIRPLAAQLNLSIRRGDEFGSARGSIMDEVWSALYNCRFVIAEISGGNDNVFYELGIAHTLNKPAILITQAAAPENVPFDVRHLRYIGYRPDAEGGVKLRTDLHTAITRLLADLEEGWPQP